jgi:hypothetical protein
MRRDDHSTLSNVAVSKKSSAEPGEQLMMRIP